MSEGLTTPTPLDAAALDVLRLRHQQLARPGETRADDDALPSDRLVRQIFQLVRDCVWSGLPFSGQRDQLVAIAALAIRAVEKLDRAANDQVAR